MMQRRLTLIGCLLLVCCGSGCSTGEVSNRDQADKMTALHNAEQASREQDGVSSE